MHIDFQCHHCRRKLRVPERHADRKARCPSCRGLVQIPGVAHALAKIPEGRSRNGAEDSALQAWLGARDRVACAPGPESRAGVCTAPEMRVADHAASPRMSGADRTDGLTVDVKTRQDQNHGPLPEGIYTAMRETRPWVIFLAVLGFIGAGFAVLGGLIALTFGSLSAGVVPGLVAFGVYMALAFVYFIPALFLHRYGSHISAFLLRRQPDRLEAALTAQASYWKLVGRVTAVLLALSLLLFLLGLILAAAQ